jgi:hypothetical protein
VYFIKELQSPRLPPEQSLALKGTKQRTTGKESATQKPHEIVQQEARLNVCSRLSTRAPLPLGSTTKDAQLESRVRQRSSCYAPSTNTNTLKKKKASNPLRRCLAINFLASRQLSIAGDINSSHLTVIVLLCSTTTATAAISFLDDKYPKVSYAELFQGSNDFSGSNLLGEEDMSPYIRAHCH